MQHTAVHLAAYLQVQARLLFTVWQLLQTQFFSHASSVGISHLAVQKRGNLGLTHSRCIVVSEYRQRCCGRVLSATATSCHGFAERLHKTVEVLTQQWMSKPHAQQM